MRIVWFRGAWYVYWRDNGRPRRTALRTADRAVAERNLIDFERSLRRKATTIAEIMGNVTLHVE